MTQIINKVTYYFFNLQVLNWRFLNWHDRLYEKSCPFKKVNKISCVFRCYSWISLFTFLSGPSLFEVLLILSLQSCFNIIAIQINVHSPYRVILRYLSWASFTGENNERILQSKTDKLFNRLIKLQLHIWAPFFSVLVV